MSGPACTVDLPMPAGYSAGGSREPTLNLAFALDGMLPHGGASRRACRSTTTVVERQLALVATAQCAVLVLDPCGELAATSGALRVATEALAAEFAPGLHRACRLILSAVTDAGAASASPAAVACPTAAGK